MNQHFWTAIVIACIAMTSGCKHLPQRTPMHWLSAKLENSNSVAQKHKTKDTFTADANLRLLAARSLEKKGLHADAIRAYKRLESDETFGPIALHRQALIHARQDETQQARDCFNRAVAGGKATAEVLADFGYFELQNGELSHAEELTRAALAQNAKMPRVHNNLGLLLSMQGQKDEALAAFQHAGCTIDQANRNFLLAFNDATNASESTVLLASRHDPLKADPESTLTAR